MFYCQKKIKKKFALLSKILDKPQSEVKVITEIVL
jgi:hypothetical protein